MDPLASRANQVHAGADAKLDASAGADVGLKDIEVGVKRLHKDAGLNEIDDQFNEERKYGANETAKKFKSMRQNVQAQPAWRDLA